MKSASRTPLEAQASTLPFPSTPEWACDPKITNIDLFRHVLATGGTGCGKTLSVVLPLLERAIQFRDERGRHSAVFVCDVKGDLAKPVLEIATACGRLDDVVTISPTSTVTTDLLEILSEDPLTGAALLYRAASGDSNSKGNAENPYWEMGAIEFIASALSWIRLLNLPLSGSSLRLFLGITQRNPLSLRGRRLEVTDLENFSKKIRGAGDNASRQLADQLGGIISLANLDDKTWSIFQSIFVQVTGRLAHPLIDSLCAKPHVLPLDSWLGDGRIFLVQLPFDLQPLQSNFLAKLLKMALFKRVLSQSPETVRPSLFIIDEAHRFVTGDDESGDQNFIDRCRAFQSGCVYATQSLNPFRALMEGSRFDAFLANINTRLFGRTLDVPTGEVAAMILGDVDLIDGYQGVQRILVQDPDPDQAPQATFDTRGVFSLKLNPVDLARLKPGEFYVAANDLRSFVAFPPWRGRNQLLPRPLLRGQSLGSPIDKLVRSGAVDAFCEALPPLTQ